MRKILRRPKVRGATGLSTSSIDRHEKAGDFPQRVRLGVNSVGWYEDEIATWIESRQRGIVEAPAAANEARRSATA